MLFFCSLNRCDTYCVVCFYIAQIVHWHVKQFLSTQEQKIKANVQLMIYNFETIFSICKKSLRLLILHEKKIIEVKYFKEFWPYLVDSRLDWICSWRKWNYFFSFIFQTWIVRKWYETKTEILRQNCSSSQILWLCRKTFFFISYYLVTNHVWKMGRKIVRSFWFFFCFEYLFARELFVILDILVTIIIVVTTIVIFSAILCNKAYSAIWNTRML